MALRTISFLLRLRVKNVCKQVFVALALRVYEEENDADDLLFGRFSLPAYE